MKKLSILILLASTAWATNYTLAISGGVWGTTGNWSPPGVPGNGDTVNIPDTMNVTVQGAVTIGASGAAGSVAVSLNNSGKLVLFQGAVLTVRGDVTYLSNNGANTSVAVSMEAGTSWIWDSSASSSPSTTRYAFGPNGNNGYRQFLSSGTASLRNSISSNTGGAAGRFSNRGFSGGMGSFTASYTDFASIGDASNAGWQIAYEYSGSNLVTWNTTYSTFTGCGVIASGNYIGVDNGSVFRHSFNTHTGSVGGGIFSGWINIATGPYTGIREIRNNVFDVALSDYFLTGTAFYAPGFTLWSNYFSQGFTLGGSTINNWAAFQGNLYREANSVLPPPTMSGNVIQNYYLLDEPVSFNPHGPQITSFSATSTSSNIVDHAGMMGSSVSSWWITNGLTPAAGNYTFSYNILLPNESNQTSWWTTAIINSGTATTWTIDHNTMMTGFATGGGTGVLSWHPTTLETVPGSLASFRSNLIWNPNSANETYKLFSYCIQDPANNCAANINVCLPANCDYNLGYNALTDGGASQLGVNYTNGGNGYADNFTSTPGQHDLASTVNPMFVDLTRNMATFDSAFLGYTAPQWSSGATYSAGQMVSNADPSIYPSATYPSGAPINYRYVNGTYTGQNPSGPGGTAANVSCSGANPKPGDYTSISRACWEWASLYHIRQAIEAASTQSGVCPGNGTGAGMWSTGTGAGQCLWDSQPIGAQGVDVILTLMQWVTAGYSPTNPLLAGSAHDATDIGAAPVTFAAPVGSPPIIGTPPPGGGVVIRGGRVVIR